MYCVLVTAALWRMDQLIILSDCCTMMYTRSISFDFLTFLIDVVYVREKVICIRIFDIELFTYVVDLTGISEHF